ncbi:cAMP-binding proteins - catabolite gene activator and regulatory subunit of cAMP-dependent protein kinases [hydrothermal vent metagenome]|uniref:cAMP-binding proteins - catabolite gene activator and regulatory subunit of cAMP-dependent protein kinases n=1 Tax=hydrothermal vent metagenome TaxID=652676 RepID=A0A3B0W946_9ZZZZ
MNFHQLLQLEGVTVVKDKGEHIFMQGDADRSLYFVQLGLLKAYYISEDGKESVKSFLLPNDIIGSLSSAYLKRDCSFNLICLEPTTLKKIPFDILHKYSKNNLEIASDMIELLLLFAMKKEQREFEFLCMSAEERFCRIAEASPVLLEKVTQNDLSRYLGITPVGLSRIKKRAHNKANALSR